MVKKIRMIDKNRRRKTSVKSNQDLYDSVGVDPTLTIEDETETVGAGATITITENFPEVIGTPLLEHYNYQEMVDQYSQVNVAQQLGNYRSAMDFLTYYTPQDKDNLSDRLKKIIYHFPNVDMGSFLTKESARINTWIIQHLFHSFGEKYIGTVYLLGGGMGLLGAMMLDTKLRFENIRSFDIHGSGQFLADEMMSNELLQDWRFKATTQDIFNIGYAENVFSTILPDGTISNPFKEIPGTLINPNISYLEKYEAWWDMVPDMRRVVVVGETGDVPRPFSSSQAFNRKFEMNYEVYTGVLQVDKKYYFMKIGYK